MTADLGLLKATHTKKLQKLQGILNTNQRNESRGQWLTT